MNGGAAFGPLGPKRLGLPPCEQLERGVTYDVRVRSVNAVGMRSGWVTLFGFAVTSPAGVTTQIDHGAFITSAAQNLDYGEFA